MNFYNTSIRLGFVPLNDCAPLAVANELGIFSHYNLNVQLSRQPGWASIRDMINYDQLDGAQSIAGIALILALGINQQKCDVCVPLFLSAQGNAITLSTSLSKKDIGNGNGLANFLSKKWRHNRPFTLAAVHKYSSHHILLLQWLRKNGIDPNDKNIEIIFLPPPLMARTLASGHIDGYCVGEPWNSEAIITGSGWSPCVSSDISYGHPEKLLLLTGQFTHERREETIQLCAALLEACRICQDPEFRDDLINILAKTKYVGVSKESIRNGLGATFFSSPEDSAHENFQLFHGGDINRPSQEKTSWLLNGYKNAGLLPETTMGSMTKIFREDIYRLAETMMKDQTITMAVS
jgi:ABC-type nitrate/sulfonate/bicarbonate transport system substrate-binding protein